MGIYNQSTVRPEIQSFLIHNTEFVDEFNKSEYCQTGDSVFFYNHNTEFGDACLYL